MPLPQWRKWLTAVVLVLLSGCAATGDINQPIPTLLVPAPQSAHQLVVMLPGRGEDLKGLERHHVAQLIQEQWPHADVLMVGLTMPFYRAGVAAQRLHDEVMVPAGKRGYQQIWLAGISLGGFGSLLYDRAYPGEVHGMLLFSPYLGDSAIHKDIRAAGGLSRWQAGVEAPIGPNNYTRELWRYLKRWSHEPTRTTHIWLAYGDKEPFRQPIELMSPSLPVSHVFMLPGRHNWTLWRKAMGKVFAAARSETTY